MDRIDRIEMTYNAIDEMIKVNGTPKPNKFGGGKWNAEEEFKIYKKQVGNRYTLLQWSIITNYFLSSLLKSKMMEKKE